MSISRRCLSLGIVLPLTILGVFMVLQARAESRNPAPEGTRTKMPAGAVPGRATAPSGKQEKSDVPITVRGYVKDHAEKIPLKGVDLELIASGNTWRKIVQTDSTGMYMFVIPPELEGAEFTLYAGISWNQVNFLPNVIKVVPHRGRNSVPDIYKLATFFRVHGHAQAPDHGPIQNVEFCMWGVPSSPNLCTLRERTDADGRVSFDINSLQRGKEFVIKPHDSVYQTFTPPRNAIHAFRLCPL